MKNNVYNLDGSEHRQSDRIAKAMAEIFEPDPVAAALISRDYASMFHLMAVQPIIDMETHDEV